MGKVAVLGLGPSIAEFKAKDYELSVGVNDIWRYVESEAVVCLNHQKAFMGERWNYIFNCRPKAFYSQIVDYDTRTDFVKIDLAPGYPDYACNIDTRYLQKSFCSPFVAAQIAWKFYGATEIHLFGVDMTNHPHLNNDICDKIKIHFKNLRVALEAKNCQMIVHGEGILTNKC